MKIFCFVCCEYSNKKMANPKKQFNHLINVNNFDGDPAMLTFFTEQVSNIITINSLKEPEALAFIKSKLYGPALQFYIDSPELKNIDNHKEFLKKLEDFFQVTPVSDALAQLNEIKLLPAENITSLAHRINKLTLLAFPNISDRQAQKNIMINYLYAAIPPTIKVKLLEKNLTDFDQIVQTAQNLFNQYARHNILNLLIPASNHENTEILNTLHSEIKELKNSIQKQQVPQSQISPQLRSTFSRKHANESSLGKNQSFFPRQRQQNIFKHKNTISCHYCGRQGHIRRNCWRLRNTQCRSTQDYPQEMTIHRNLRHNFANTHGLPAATRSHVSGGTNQQMSRFNPHQVFNPSNVTYLNGMETEQ